MPAFVALLGALERAGVARLVIGLRRHRRPRPDRYVVYLAQGGLGLPDESYYREDAARRRSATAYVAHVARMLALAGSARRPRRPRGRGHGARDPARRRATGTR